MNQYTELAEQVMNHARKNYSRDGWDFVVECLTVSEITAELAAEGITTERKAIAHYAELYGILDEQRQEAKGLAL